MKPRKLVWTEGLFVTQHHFQQLDRYHETLLNERMRSALPYDWGVVELETDERALAAGQFTINKLSAVLPSGTPITIGEQSDDAPPPRAFESAFTPQMRHLDVFVALPHEADAGANVEMEAGAQPLGRFVREEARVPDFNTGTNEHAINWARRNLSVLLGEERRDAADAIRVAQLVRAPSGSVVLRETCVPPVLRIGASPFLMSGFRRVLSHMTAKQQSIAQTRRQRTKAAVDFQASDAAKFWLLHSMNDAIPTFSHLVDQGTSHPELAYLVLGKLIGDLCTFAVDGDPTAIPKFNYLELGEVFEPMFARVLALLDAVIAERYVQIPLQRRDDGMYLGNVSESKVWQYEFFLVADGTLPEAQIRDRLPKLTKIASWSQIGPILNSAVNGARLELEYHPPGALPIRPGMVFFKVQRMPEYWNDMRASGTIAIYVPFDAQSVNCSLFAVDPENLR